jgi:hypothetical protein
LIKVFFTEKKSERNIARVRNLIEAAVIMETVTTVEAIGCIGSRKEN